MAVIKNPDGSFTVDDPTGLRPPTTLPPGSDQFMPELANATPAVPPVGEGTIIRDNPYPAEPQPTLPPPPEQPPLPPVPTQVTQPPLPTPPGQEIFREVPPEWLRGTPMEQSSAGPPGGLSLFNAPPAPSLASSATAMAQGGPNAPNPLRVAPGMVTPLGPAPPMGPYAKPGQIGADFVPAPSEMGPIVPPGAIKPKDVIGDRWSKGQDVLHAGANPAELAPGPTGPTGASPPGAAPEGYGATGQGLFEYLTAPKPATPGVRIPEHNELGTFQITKGLPPLKPETKKAVEEAYRARAIEAVTEAEKLQAAKALEGLQYQKASEDSRQRLAELGKMRAQQEQQVKDRMNTLDQRIAGVRALAAEDPQERYWTRKGAFGSLMTKIGIGLADMGSAVTGQPNRVYQAVQDEISNEFKHQAMKIDTEAKAVGEDQNLLQQLRQSFMSPEAADYAARALLTESAASQAKAMTAMTQGWEARKNGMDLMAQLGFDAAMWRAKSEEAEADRTTQMWRHKVAQVLGGSPGGKPTLGEAIMRLRTLDPRVTVDQALTFIESHGLNGLGGGDMSRARQSEIQSARERQVQVPPTAAEVLGMKPGTVLWTSQGNETSRKLNESLRAGSLYLDNLGEIRRIVNSGPWETLPTPDKRRLEVLVAENRYYLKGNLIKEALTKGELENYAPLTGEDLAKFFSIAVNNAAQLDAAERGAVQRIRSDAGALYSDPSAKPGSAVTIQQGQLPTGAVRKR